MKRRRYRRVEQHLISSLGPTELEIPPSEGSTAGAAEDHWRQRTLTRARAHPVTRLPALIPDRRNEADDVFFILHTGVVHDAIADLPLGESSRGERFYEKYRIVKTVLKQNELGEKGMRIALYARVFSTGQIRQRGEDKSNAGFNILNLLALFRPC